MSKTRTNSGRRNFLIAVGAGGAAAVAAIGAKTAPNGQQAAEKKEPERSGYQLSEHIRNYYRTTLV